MFQEKLKSLDAHDAALWDAVCLPTQMGTKDVKIIDRYDCYAIDTTD